jgi:hypothetical protein
VRSCGYSPADTPYTAHRQRTGLTMGLGPGPVRPSWLINTIVMLENMRENCTALALVGREGCVHLGVRTGRGLSSARGSAESQASKMPVYLGTR